MKKIFFYLVALTVLFLLITMPIDIIAQDAESVSVYVNGKLLETDQPAIIINGRTFVPLRAIGEALKYDVQWYEGSQTAEIQNEIIIIGVQAGDCTLSKIDNGYRKFAKTISLDMAPIMRNERMLVPIRAISEAFNAEVIWDEKNWSVNINIEYDYIADFNQYGFARVAQNGKVGFINEMRELVVPLIYDDKVERWSYINGLIEVKKGDKYGVINQKCEEVIPFVYDYISCGSDGMIQVGKDGKMGCVDSNNFVIVPVIYDEIKKYDNIIIAKQNEKFGGINKNGDVVVPFIYNDLTWCPNGKMICAQKDEKWGYIDENGEVLIPLIYDSIGLFLFEQENIEYACLDGKYGYIDRTGATVIPFIYDKAESFVHEIAVVYKDGKCGAINQNNETIIPFEYDYIGVEFLVFGSVWVAVKNDVKTFFLSDGSTIRMGENMNYPTF